MRASLTGVTSDISTKDILRPAVLSGRQAVLPRLFHLLRSPRVQLLLCLGLALMVRVVLLVRAHGMMEGDEAVLGIQAERILRGQFPIYFYGQAYMGSWDAYLMAPLIAIFGPSAAVLHSVPLAESLLLVPLLGALAKRLYGERARLPAMLLAALPPLYVGAMEIHTLGGYVETLVIGTALMLLTTMIAERWALGRSTLRLWLLVGLLVGLAFWIDPLISYFLGACVLWGAPFALMRIRRGWCEGVSWLRGLAGGAGGCLAALVVGMFPALIYAFQHQGVNYTFLFSSRGARGLRLDVVGYMLNGAFRRVVGFTSLWLPPYGRGHLLALLLGALAFLLTLLAVGNAAMVLILRYPTRRNRWRGLSADTVLLWWKYAFAPIALLVIFLLYWRGPAAGGWVYLESTDRYMTPATIPVSLMLASFLAAPCFPTQWLEGRLSRLRRRWAGSRAGRLRSLALAGVLALLLLAFAWPYSICDGVRALQSPYAQSLTFPGKDRALLSYLEEQHIHYVWVSHWVGQVVMYLENERIICADYVTATFHLDQPRFPETVQQVAQADRASFIVRADPALGKPALAKELENLQVSYRIAHFGLLWVVTPISRTVQPHEVITALLAGYYF